VGADAVELEDDGVVRTRSVKGDGRTWEWRGRHDGTYRVSPSQTPLERPGTQVTLRPNAQGREHCSPERVRELAVRFGGLLPFPVRFSARGDEVLLNAPPPWRERFDSPRERRERLLAYGRELFGVEHVDVIPLRSEAGGVDGVAYVLPFTPHFGTRQRHRVYLKHMLLTEEAEDLLPEWAFFVR
jgi:molecular chaperone HtpG